MTTIAYHHKSKTIAVESRMTAGSIIVSDNCNKTIKNEAGLWVFCGSAEDIILLCELKHGEKTDNIPDCAAFLLSNGKCYEVHVSENGKCKHMEITFNDGKGSGYEFAIAAMDHGKSAKEAVKYAITRDIYSGGRVREFKV